MFQRNRNLRRSSLLSCVLALFLLVLPAGCASVNGATAENGRDPNLITLEELQQSGEHDMYSAVQRLRPAFLQRLGTVTSFHTTESQLLHVYVDGSLLGDVESLRQLQVAQVSEIRRLSGSDATQRFGTNNALGALVVKTRSR